MGANNGRREKVEVIKLTAEEINEQIADRKRGGWLEVDGRQVLKYAPLKHKKRRRR